jgi:hypothetical protein
MLYRLEHDQEDGVAIKHVETERKVGYVRRTVITHGDGRTALGCKVMNNTGEELALISERTTRCPMECAAMAAATYQKHYNYPDVSEAPWDDHNDGAERRLATRVADTALAFARAFCEAAGQGLTADTRDKFASSITELSLMSWLSSFGCFDADAWKHRAYFAGPSSVRRLSFSEAARRYGAQELSNRHPDLTDVEQQKLLDWVLQWVTDLLSSELAQQHKAAALLARLH